MRLLFVAVAYVHTFISEELLNLGQPDPVGLIRVASARPVTRAKAVFIGRR